MACLICTEPDRYLFKCDTCTITACLECVRRMVGCPAKCGSKSWIDPSVNLPITSNVPSEISAEFNDFAFYFKLIGDRYVADRVRAPAGWVNLDWPHLRQGLKLVGALAGMFKFMFSSYDASETVESLKFSITGVTKPVVNRAVLKTRLKIDVSRKELNFVPVQRHKYREATIRHELYIEGDRPHKFTTVHNEIHQTFICLKCDKVYQRKKSAINHASKCGE